MRAVRISGGISPIGNLYKARSDAECAATVSAFLEALKAYGAQTLVLDGSNKYGAGLANERVAAQLLQTPFSTLGFQEVRLHHKVGWKPRPLRAGEDPSHFEPGVWALAGRQVTVDQSFAPEDLRQEVAQFTTLFQPVKSCLA